MRQRPFLAAISLLVLTGMGCGIIGFIENPAPLTGPSYWAAETGTPMPTVTVFLGTSTPVYADTPVPNIITTTPEWTTVTATPILPPPTATPSLPGVPKAREELVIRLQQRPSPTPPAALPGRRFVFAGPRSQS